MTCPVNVTMLHAPRRLTVHPVAQSACSLLRCLTRGVHLYGSEAEVLMYALIHKYIHNTHGSEDATLQSTIDIQEHSTAKTFPLYSYLLVHSYSIRAPPWPSPPAHCELVPGSVTSQSLSDDVVASPVRLPPRGTSPITDAAKPSSTRICAAEMAVRYAALSAC